MKVSQVFAVLTGSLVVMQASSVSDFAAGFVIAMLAYLTAVAAAAEYEETLPTEEA